MIAQTLRHTFGLYQLKTYVHGSLRKNLSHSVRVCRDGRRVCGMTEILVHLQLLALLKLTGCQTSIPIRVGSS
jgi:hypothetical protein